MLFSQNVKCRKKQSSERNFREKCERDVKRFYETGPWPGIINHVTCFMQNAHMTIINYVVS